MELRKIDALDIMRYYVTYMDIEKQILIDVHSNSITKRETALKKYMNSHMKIGRNFRKFDYKYETIYNLTLDSHTSNPNDIESLSKKFLERDILSGEIKNAKVAASKLLWLFNQNTIIIDNLNKTILNIKTNNYSDYTSKWEMVFKSKINEINSIIQKYNFANIDTTINKPWFKMRVFDQYLWALQAGE